VETNLGRTTFFGAVLLAAAALALGCSSGIARKYDVNFGLKADMSDEARDPNSVAMLERESKGKRPLQRPPEEVMTTEGVDEALDDDMDDISAVAEGTDKEKVKSESGTLVPPPAPPK
jgi:hypothetical protein